MGIQERKEREKERRRQQIMVAAKRVFANRGFAKSTMEDIAHEAELSPGTIYLYFKNKDELYASLSLRVLQYLNIRLEQILRESRLPTSDMIGELKQALMDVYAFDPTILLNMFHLQSGESLKTLSPELLGRIQNLSGNSIKIIADLFQQAIESGDCGGHHPVALSDITWGLFSGVVLWEESKKVFNKDKDFLKETVDIAFDILERGLRQQAPVSA
jgi:AcrR family transcriptional regulator